MSSPTGRPTGNPTRPDPTGDHPSGTLTDALAALVRAAGAAGLREAQARSEGEALAAAVAESAPGAHLDWRAQTGHDQTQDFFDAASRGRRWRAAPTRLLEHLHLSGSPQAETYAQALAAITTAATQLGEATQRVAGNASLAAASQLNLVNSLRTGQSSSTPPGPPPPGPALLRQTPPPEAAIPASTDSENESPGSETAGEVPAPSLEELLAELDGLVGLAEVKAEIHRTVAVLRVEQLRSDAGLRSPTLTRHLVFVGNPGTGKTTVARLVGGIYRALGLLSKGQLIEVDRSELVAGYLGQTAMKTAEVTASAVGGVLFIDEAYTLAGDQYGQEAVDTLVKEMEDHRDDLVLIVAGYPDPMGVFIAGNPGLSSRFRTTIDFDDYSEAELVDILSDMAANADYDASEDCLTRFQSILTTTPRGPTFGNGRFARNCLEAAIGHQAWRLRDIEEPTIQQLRELSPDDLDPAEESP